MPFQIGRVRENQIGVGYHFGRISVRIDDMRDHVVAVFILVGQHLMYAAYVHGRVPRHVRHIHKQRVDLVWHACMRIRDHHMHQPVGRHRVFPGIGFVDPCRVAFGIEQQVLWAVSITKVRAIKCRTGGDFSMWFRMRRCRLGVGRFETHATGHFDRAKDDLQHMQCAAGLEPVRVR